MSSSHLRRATAAVVGAAVLALPSLARAQEEEEAKEPFRTRVSLGPQVTPSYPGSDDLNLGAYVDIDRARGDDPFPFEAPDESFGVPLIRAGTFEIGPAVNWLWKRDAEDVGADLPEVDISIEPGAYLSVGLGESFRVRGEVRKGVTGHKGWIASAGADAIFRDGDDWLFSIGPRANWSDDRYQNAYFGVAPEDSLPSGLPAYEADSGFHSVGATAGLSTQFSPRWGVTSYVQYERLVGDAADSPVVRVHGSRDQFSGGVALSYTFGRGL